MSNIHPTAIVDPSAEIAASAHIGAYCVVGARAQIGEDCVLRAFAHVGPLTQMGRGNEIHAYALVGGDPQDLKFRGEPTWLTLGDYNQIREHVTIHRGTGNGGGYTRVGNHNLFMVNTHIAHDCVIGNHTVCANNVMLAGHVHIEDHANIGGAAGLHHFVRVGYCGFVGGMARAAKDVPPFMIVEGSPSSVRGFNQIGMSRLGLPEAEIDAAKQAYKTLFRAKGGAIASKAKALKEQFPGSKVIARICDSVAQAGDGVYGRAMETRRGDDKRARR